MAATTFETLPKAVDELSNKFDNLERLIQEKIGLSQNASDEILTVRQAAEFLHLEDEAIYRLMSGKKLPYYKPSKLCYFFKTDLIDYLKTSRVETKKEAEERIQVAAEVLINKRKATG